MMKMFFDEQKILGYLYLELKEQPNELFAAKMYNRTIEIPNEVKILKCLGEKKAKKHVEHVKKNKKYRESMEKKKTGLKDRVSRPPTKVSGKPMKK